MYTPRKRYQRTPKAKNFLPFNTSNMSQVTNLGQDPKNFAKDLRNIITPVQLTRLKQDLATWREAISEAERAYYPFRVKQQRLYIDTVLNGHMYSVMERRKDLSLLRAFQVQDAKGNKSDVLTQMLEEQKWFQTFLSYALDALFFGYSLISLGDIVDNNIQEPSLVPRWFVSPDRFLV